MFEQLLRADRLARSATVQEDSDRCARQSSAGRPADAQP